MSNPKFNELENSKWITQREAASLREVSPSAISFLLRKGRLRSKIIAGRRLVYREDALSFKPLVNGVGRPSKHTLEVSSAKIDRKKWITLKEAADLRQTAPDVIRAAIKRKRMRTLKNKGVTFVRKEDVLNYQPRIDFNPEYPSQSILPPGAKPEDWITMAAAAQIRGVHQETIREHAAHSRIRSIKKGRTRLVHRNDVINFKRKPGPGRPKKK